MLYRLSNLHEYGRVWKHFYKRMEIKRVTVAYMKVSSDFVFSTNIFNDYNVCNEASVERHLTKVENIASACRRKC